MLMEMCRVMYIPFMYNHVMTIYKNLTVASTPSYLTVASTHFFSTVSLYLKIYIQLGAQNS